MSNSVEKFLTLLQSKIRDHKNSFIKVRFFKQKKCSLPHLLKTIFPKQFENFCQFYKVSEFINQKNLLKSDG